VHCARPAIDMSYEERGHTEIAWAWSDNGAGGGFSPSAAVRSPSYTAPVNATSAAKAVTLTVTATCKWYYPWVTSSQNVGLTVAGSATP